VQSWQSQSWRLGMGWCEMKDLIDFPCSPAWTSFYAREGITADYPREYYAAPITLPVEQIRELDDAIKRIELLKLSGPVTKQELGEVKYLVNKLMARVNVLTKRDNEGY
jgi:hypothetical protein